MKKKIEFKRLIGILILLIRTGAVCVVGYQVIVKAGELPGKLGSVSVAARNLDFIQVKQSPVQKISYDTMRYGYMDDLMLAQMDALDRSFDKERMEEVRAINNLTVMSEITLNKIAYQEAKAEREVMDQKKKEAALAASRAREAKIAQAKAAATQQKTYAVAPVSAGSGDTASRGGLIGEPVYISKMGKSLGNFEVTAYCTCRICCGIYSGRNRTASGTVPTSNRTIAVDTNVIPFGTRVVINGQVYVAEDRGGAIKGNRIDMFFMTHNEALHWGRKTCEVFLVE